MVDETVRAKLRDGEEAWPLHDRSALCCWDEGVQRQAREIVARQEAFSGQVAIGIEVRAAIGLPPLQHVQLLGGSKIPPCRFLTLSRPKACPVLDAVCFSLLVL